MMMRKFKMLVATLLIAVSAVGAGAAIDSAQADSSWYCKTC